MMLFEFSIALPAATLAVVFTLALLLVCKLRLLPLVATSARRRHPTKYASISSSDFRRPATVDAATVTQSSGTASLPLDSDLDPQAEAEYAAARLQSRLESTLLKVHKLLASNLVSGRVTSVRLDAARLDGLASAAGLLPAVRTAFPAYDAFEPTLPSLRRFAHVRNHTHCIFARKAKVAGSPRLPSGSGSVTNASSVEQQTLAALPGFVDFTLRVKSSYPTLRNNEAAAKLNFDDPESLLAADTKELLDWPTPLAEYNLDAFVIEIADPDGVGSGSSHGSTVTEFARTVCSVLSTLSFCDPVMVSNSEADHDSYGVDITAAQCMTPILLSNAAAEQTFNSPRWHFTFLGETFFVTAFAPCYPSHHARYMFLDAARDKPTIDSDHDGNLVDELRTKCYLLFQPELSFLRHNLTPDTPHTNWSAPVTERDRIRCAFRTHGRAYPIPPTVAYPAAAMIVPPKSHFSDRVVRWWHDRPMQEGEEEKDEEESRRKHEQEHDDAHSSADVATLSRRR